MVQTQNLNCVDVSLVYSILCLGCVGNLLLTEDKNVIKLADFGLAREETAGEMTAEAGTYRWMAPEVLKCSCRLYIYVYSKS